MFSFGRSKEGMPASAREAEMEELAETSPEVLAKLREMAQEAADHMKDVEGPVDSKLVADAAYFVALAAEHRGEPYTLDSINNEETAELMHRALKARAELKDVDSTIVLDNGDMQVGTTVQSDAEVGEMTRAIKEENKRDW